MTDKKREELESTLTKACFGDEKWQRWGNIYMIDIQDNNRYLIQLEITEDDNFRLFTIHKKTDKEANFKTVKTLKGVFGYISKYAFCQVR